jgi:tRNA threonylcarbamoyladenosine biosynthesis protein TsaB
MILLAADTATRSCSVAVTNQGSLLAELTTVSDQTHSRHLLKMISSVIETAGLTTSELDGFAVTVGPGSFTGLRIGISSIKGLAVATNKPAVGISSLEALAAQTAPCSYLVCSLLDARKGQVYFSRYRWEETDLTKECEEMVSAPGDMLAGIREPCVFVGSGVRLYQEMIKTQLGERAYFAPENQNIIRAATVARLGLRRFDHQTTDDIDRLVPHYVRKSDAELNFVKTEHPV